jgi:hypothetical protein
VNGTSVSDNVVTSAKIVDATIVNADISGSAAIAYSKLNLASSVTNSDLAGSISDTKLATISTALKVSNSATTATAANTASAIVARDASGNFTANLITGNLSGTSTNVTGIVAVANGGTGTTTSTGTGALVLNTSPTLVTPYLGTPTSVTLTNGTGLPIATGVSGLGTGVATYLATPSSANLLAAMTDETGTGALVFANTPTLVTPIIGAATGTSLSLTGNLSAAAGTFSSTLSAGASTLGATTVGGILGVSGDVAVNTNKFTVAATTGNTLIAGTLGVTGATTLSGTSAHGGASTFSSTVNVTGETTLTSLTTTGAATFSSTVTIPTGAGLNRVLTSDANGGATWNSNPNAAFRLVSSSATYTVSAMDDKYVIYTNAATGTISLPAITSTMSGKEFIIKNISNFNVTISANGSQKIVADFANNAATFATLGVEASNNWVKLIADGTNSQWILFRALF